MKLIKKIYEKISAKYFKIICFFKIIYLSIFYKNKIYLFNVPFHGNLGDQAILMAEEKFLRDNFKNMKVIEIPSLFLEKNLNLIIKVIKNRRKRRGTVCLYTAEAF